MQSKKRRPTSSSRTHKGKITGSHLQPPRPPPHPNTLLINKYLLPALQEEDKHTAYLITRFLSGTSLDTARSPQSRYPFVSISNLILQWLLHFKAVPQRLDVSALKDSPKVGNSKVPSLLIIQFERASSRQQQEEEIAFPRQRH